MAYEKEAEAHSLADNTAGGGITVESRLPRVEDGEGLLVLVSKTNTALRDARQTKR